MAKITKSDHASKGPEHFSLGSAEFDLDSATDAYETSDPEILSNARANRNLHVEEDVVAPDPTAQSVDPLDPHRNPAADHLSSRGSDEAVSAADANEAAIQDVVQVYKPAAGQAPSVTETLQATFDAVGADAAPQPQVPEDHTPAPDPAPPTPDPAPAADQGQLTDFNSQENN